jgi:small subunit ribosomal protein S17
VSDEKTNGTGRKQRKGRVVSDSMDKTIVVEISRVIQHPLYKKYLTRNSRFKAHDEDEEAHPGDFVLIEETRPLSKTKRWRLTDILQEATEVQREAVSEDESSEETENE